MAKTKGSRRGAPQARSRVTPEISLAGLVLLGVVIVACRFWQQGFLPEPFYYHVSKSFMDFYTPAVWANNSSAYSQQHSLYPPLSFVVLRIITLKSCYALGDLGARDCDWLARLFLLAIFCVNLILVFATYRIANARTALPRTIAMGVGLPMLYALERGNLIIACFTFFALGYGDLLRHRWMRWLALALSMNFKPYIGLVAMPLVIKRRWPWVAGVGLLSVAVYLVTLAIYGSGGPLEIIANDSKYAVAASKDGFSDLYYATAYWPLIRLLQALPPDLHLASAPVAGFWSLVLTIALRVAQVASLACLVAAAFRPHGVDVRRLGALVAGVSITAFTTGSAGYAQIFLFFLLFFEPWRGATRITLLIATYLLCVPLDHVFLPVGQERAFSYLGGREVLTHYGVSVGQIIRPGLLLIIQYGLIVLNLGDIFQTRGQAAVHRSAMKTV